jgi:hypothetical protein
MPRHDLLPPRGFVESGRPTELQFEPSKAWSRAPWLAVSDLGLQHCQSEHKGGLHSSSRGRSHLFRHTGTDWGQFTCIHMPPVAKLGRRTWRTGDLQPYSESSAAGLLRARILNSSDETYVCRSPASGQTCSECQYLGILDQSKFQWRGACESEVTRRAMRYPADQRGMSRQEKHVSYHRGHLGPASL